MTHQHTETTSRQNLRSSSRSGRWRPLGSSRSTSGTRAGSIHRSRCTEFDDNTSIICKVPAQPRCTPLSRSSMRRRSRRVAIDSSITLLPQSTPNVRLHDTPGETLGLLNGHPSMMNQLLVDQRSQRGRSGDGHTGNCRNTDDHPRAVVSAEIDRAERGSDSGNASDQRALSASNAKSDIPAPSRYER